MYTDDVFVRNYSTRDNSEPILQANLTTFRRIAADEYLILPRGILRNGLEYPSPSLIKIYFICCLIGFLAKCDTSRKIFHRPIQFRERFRINCFR